MALIRVCQNESFHNEIDLLKNNSVIHKSPPIYNLKPFLDTNGTLRVSGRLQESGLMYETKHPAILSKAHPVSYLLIKFHHEKNLHCGATSVLCDIRQRFWIVHGMKLCKNVLKNCIKCQRYKSNSYNEEYGPLPVDRVDCASM